MAKNKPKRAVIFVLFRILSFFIYLLPIRLALRIGQALGKIAFHSLKNPRKITLDNLDIAFGSSKSPQEKRIIAGKVFENLGKNFIEIVALSKFNKGNIDNYIECKGIEIIERFIQKGGGGIVLTAHFGNWEFLAHYFAIKGYSVNVIARRVRMEQFEKVLKRVRKRNKVNVLYRDASAKDVIALLKKNEFVGIMPDQDMDSISGVFVDFFGKPAYTPNGPAALNRLTKAPIIPCFIVRKSFGHEILIEEPIELRIGEDKEKDILENTQRYTKVIENYIKRFPSQWVWFHERWKTRP
ncbi:lysophospholipid acyltransferase family protein [Candidatus Omnitrophota bacterium]